jgi:transposase
VNSSNPSDSEKRVSVVPQAHETQILESWAQRGEARASLRARIVLLSAAGRRAAEVSAELGVGVPTVYKWRKRFRRAGIAGLVDLPRSGQPRRLSGEKRAEIVRVTLQEPPLRGKRWSIRTLACSLGVTQHQVRQIWAEAGLKPHETNEPRSIVILSARSDEDTAQNAVTLNHSPSVQSSSPIAPMKSASSKKLSSGAAPPASRPEPSAGVKSGV